AGSEIEFFINALVNVLQPERRRDAEAVEAEFVFHKERAVKGFARDLLPQITVFRVRRVASTLRVRRIGIIRRESAGENVFFIPRRPEAAQTDVAARSVEFL